MMRYAGPVREKLKAFWNKLLGVAWPSRDTELMVLVLVLAIVALPVLYYLPKYQADSHIRLVQRLWAALRDVSRYIPGPEIRCKDAS